MKYQRIPEPVDAEEYKVGMEDGWGVLFSGNFFDYKEHFDTYEQAQEFIDDNMGYPKVDFEDKAYEIIYEDPRAYINGIGGKNYVMPGWFIVTNEYGGK